jgi:hypothetical protein
MSLIYTLCVSLLSMTACIWNKWKTSHMLILIIWVFSLSVRSYIKSTLFLQWVFLPEPPVRRKLVLPPPVKVDYRAACFCHRELIDIGFVCSVCLSSKYAVQQQTHCVPNRFLPSNFEAGIANVVSSVCFTCPVHPILLDLTAVIIYLMSTHLKAPHYMILSMLLCHFSCLRSEYFQNSLSWCFLTVYQTSLPILNNKKNHVSVCFIAGRREDRKLWLLHWHGFLEFSLLLSLFLNAVSVVSVVRKDTHLGTFFNDFWAVLCCDYPALCWQNMNIHTVLSTSLQIY